MNFIATFNLIGALIVVGLLIYIFNPIVDFVYTNFPQAPALASTTAAVMFIWGIIAGINMIVQIIKFWMAMAEKKGGDYIF